MRDSEREREDGTLILTKISNNPQSRCVYCEATPQSYNTIIIICNEKQN